MTFQNGFTAAHIAAASGHTGCLWALLLEGGGSDKEATSLVRSKPNIHIIQLRCL